MIKTCPDECLECAAGKILCMECNRHFKGLAGHVYFHKWSLDDYRRKYTQDGSLDDVPVGWTAKDRPSLKNATQSKTTAERDPLADTHNNLSVSEKQYHDKRYAVLFDQADEDPALSSAIRDIVMGEINVMRYQEQISRINLRFKNKVNIDDMNVVAQLSKLVKEAQDTNLKMLDKLNLTREKKQKAKQVIESTPSRYVSAYERILRNYTPEQFKKAQNEEDMAVARLVRKQSYFESIVQEPEKEVE